MANENSTSAKIIDINCDLGEGETIDDCKKDAELMPYISSCNIACAGHAGNELVIRETLKYAIQNKIKTGAHPGYPDRENFGRKSMPLSHEELIETLMSQLNFFINIAQQQSVKIEHVKLHGALYNDAENDAVLAMELARFFSQFHLSLKVLGLAGGAMQEACSKQNVAFIAEGFMDRTYLSDGRLTPRSYANAVIEDKDECVRQALALATNSPIKTSDGTMLQPKVDSICLHGDNPEALSIVQALQRELSLNGLAVK